MDGMKLFAIYLAVMNVIGVAGMPLILVCQAALAIYLMRLYVL